MFILISFGFSVGVVIAGIGGVGMRRAMGHLCYGMAQASYIIRT